MSWRRWGVFAVYPVVAAGALAPLMRHITTRVAAGDGSGDSFLFLWNLWWVKVAAFERFASPYQTELLYWPQPVSLVLHSMNTANGILSAPIQAAFPGTAGLVFTLNFMVFLTFVLTGISAHLLAGDYGARPIAATLAGLVAMLLPYRLWHLNHLDLLTMQWGFCCLLWLPRALEPGAWRARVILSVFATLTTYSDYEAAVYTALASLFVVGWQFLSSPGKQHAMSMIRGAATSAAIAFVLHIPLLIALLNLGERVRPAAGGELYTANLFAFAIPGASGTAHEAFLGTAFVIVLILLALRVRHRAFWMWTALGALFLVLSLGPTLRAGHWTGLNDLLPYAWMKSLMPFMALSRAPVRMAGFGGVCLAIAMGTAFQRNGTGSRFEENVTRSRFAVAGLIVLLVAERWPWTPVPTVEAIVPETYRTLASEPGNFAIRPLPESYNHRVIYMFWQTVHRKPMTSGYVSRPTDAVRRSIVEWQSLSGDALANQLKSAGVKFVIVHTDDPKALLTSEPSIQRQIEVAPALPLPARRK